MALGYLLCVFMDCDESRSINLQKKEQGQDPAVLIEQAWSIKDLRCIVMEKEHYFLAGHSG